MVHHGNISGGVHLSESVEKETIVRSKSKNFIERSVAITPRSVANLERRENFVRQQRLVSQCDELSVDAVSATFILP